MEGTGIAILLVLCMAANIKLLSFLSKRIDNLVLCFYEILLGTISFYLIFCFFKGNLFSVPTTNDYLYFGLSGLCSYGVAGYLAILHIRLAGEEKNALLSPLITVMAVLSGVLILNESINLQKVIGAIIVVSSVFYYEWKTKTASVYLPKTKEFLLMMILVVIIVVGIMLVRLQIRETNLSAFQIVFIRYLGAVPVLVTFLFFFIVNSKANISKGFSRKDWAILLLSILLSAIGINYLWIMINQTLSNLLLQTILSTLPLVISFFNVISYKKIPPRGLIYVSLIAISGIILLFI